MIYIQISSSIKSNDNLIDLYEAWNKPEQAKKWRAELQKQEAVTE